MRIGILQPGYLPWLGFFEQIHHCDVFVLYDDVQYDKHGWRNRNRIKTANGLQWLTVPVRFSLSKPTLVKDVKIDNQTNWQKKHLMSLKQNYGKAPFFKDYWQIFEETFENRTWDLLNDLDVHLIEKMVTVLGINGKKFARSSELNISGNKVERLISIIRHFDGNSFYEGAAGRDYLKPELFEPFGIQLEFQEYQHPIYSQLHGDFASHLSIVDLLFNHGINSLNILISGSKREKNQ